MFDLITETLYTNQEYILTGIISVFFAFLIWSVKESYKKHCEEVALLGKIEIIFAHNLGSLLTNQSYFEEWLKALRQPRLYNCAFRTYIFFNHEDYTVTNRNLLNKLITFDFSLKGLQADTDLFFGGYHKSSLMLLPENLVNEWNNLNQNTLDQSSKYQLSFEQAIDDAKEVIGLTRAYAKQKRNTPYGWARFVIGRNLLPEIKKETVAKYKEEVDLELKKKQGGVNITN